MVLLSPESPYVAQTLHDIVHHSNQYPCFDTHCEARAPAKDSSTKTLGLSNKTKLKVNIISHNKSFAVTILIFTFLTNLLRPQTGRTCFGVAQALVS